MAGKVRHYVVEVDAMRVRRFRQRGDWSGDRVGSVSLVRRAVLVTGASRDGIELSALPISGVACPSLLTGGLMARNHNVVNGDIIDQDVPWSVLNWTTVHHGQFPLWNGYSGTGLPQFLNFESGVLALPSLVGYLFPLAWSFLITIAVKLLIAGIGTYVFVRAMAARSERHLPAPPTCCPDR